MRYHLNFFSNPRPNKKLWSHGSNKCGIDLAQKPNSENKQIERKNTWRNNRFFKTQTVELTQQPEKKLEEAPDSRTEELLFFFCCWC
jgi:hypothetical protein